MSRSVARCAAGGLLVATLAGALLSIASVLTSCRGHRRSPPPPPAGLLAATETGILYSIDTGTGVTARVSGLGIRGLQRIGGLAFEPLGGRLFASDTATNLLVVIDPRTWDVAILGDPGVPSVEALAWDPRTARLLGVSGQTLLAIDTVTGQASPIGTTGVANIYSLAFDPGSGALYGHVYAGDTLLEINAATGAARAIGRTGYDAVLALTFDPRSGRLLAVDSRVDALLSIDPTTAAVTRIGSVGFGTVAGLALALDTGTLFGFDIDACEIITIDPATGLGTRAATLGTRNLEGLAFDPGAGVLYAVRSDPSRIVRVDRSTGVVTHTIPLAFRMVRSIEYDPGRGRLYAIELDANQLLAIDPTNGSVRAIGTLNLISVEGLAFDPAADRLYGGDRLTGQLVEIDLATAATRPIAALGSLANVGMMFHASTRSILSLDAPRIAAIDPVTGSSTTLGVLPVVGLTGLAPGPDPDFVYGVGDNQLVEIDLRTFAMRAVGALGSSRLQGLALDPPTGRLRGGDSVLGLVSVDPATGEMTAIAGAPRATTGLTYDASSAILYEVVQEGGLPSRYNLYAMDWPGTTRRLVGTLGFNVSGVTHVPGRAELLAVADDRLLTIDPATARVQSVLVMSEPLRSIAWEPTSGSLFGVATTSSLLLRVDPLTGGLSSSGVRVPYGVRAMSRRY